MWAFEAVLTIQLARMFRSSTTADNALDCQKQCRDTSWCSSFVFNTLLKSCDLQETCSLCAFCFDMFDQCLASTFVPPLIQDVLAKPVHTGILYQMSGPPSCKATVKFEVDVNHDGALEVSTQNLTSVVKAALVVVAGRYPLYFGGNNQNGRDVERTLPVVHPDELFAVPDKVSSTHLHYNVMVDIPSSRALYFYNLLTHDQTGDEFHKAMNNFTGNIWGGFKFPGKVPVVSVSNAKLDVKGDRWHQRIARPNLDEIQLSAVAADVEGSSMGQGWKLLGALSLVLVVYSASRSGRNMRGGCLDLFGMLMQKQNPCWLVPSMHLTGIDQ